MIDWSQLVRLDLYTPTQMILFGGGCYLWVIVYAIYVRSIIKEKFIEMPVFAACGNIAWEYVWGFTTTTNMGILLQRCYQIWFFFDLFIFYSVLRYGAQQVMTQPLRRHFRPLAILCALGWGGAFFAMVKSKLDTPIGANSAFILNFLISLLYIFLFLQRTEASRMSYSVAWLKMIGTGMNTVFMNIYPGYADDYLLRYLSIFTTVLDCSYIYLMWHRRRVTAMNEKTSEVRSAPDLQALPAAPALHASLPSQSLP